MATTSDQLEVLIALTQPTFSGEAALQFTTDFASDSDPPGTFPFPRQDITRDRQNPGARPLTHQRIFIGKPERSKNVTTRRHR